MKARIIEETHVHEEWVKFMKAAGQSIIDNAESIVGTEPFLANVTVTVYLCPHEVPRINVDRDFYPESARDLI